MGVIEWFSHFSAQTEGDEAYAVVFSRPALLWPERWPQIETWIATRSPGEQVVMASRLTLLKHLAGQLEADPGGYPVGLGPIEGLAERINAGEIGPDHGIALAGGDDVAGALSPLYVRVVAERERLKAVEGEWCGAVRQMKLLLAALDAIGAEPAIAAPAELSWMEVVTAACMDIPDGRLFHAAARRGRAFAEAAQAAGETALASEAWHRLGVLHLDTYVAGRTNVHFESEMQRWRARLSQAYGIEVAATDEVQLPEPADALALADGFLARAAALRQGERRGLTLKARAEALFWREIAGGPADRQGVADAAREALLLLDGERYPRHVGSLRQLLGVAMPEEKVEEPAASGQDDLLWLTPDEVAARHLGIEVAELYMRAATSATPSEPARAAALFRRIAPQILSSSKDSVKVELVNRLMMALSVLFDTPGLLRAADGDYTKARQELMERARNGGWLPTRLAAALAALATHLTAVDREDEAQPILDDAARLLGKEESDLSHALRILRASLRVGAAVNALNAGHLRAATEHYVEAVGAWHEAGCDSLALDAIVKAADTALRPGSDGFALLAVGLAHYGPVLEARGAAGVGEQLQSIWQRIVARVLNTDRVNLELMALVLQAAKGGAFANMLRSDYDWRRDPEATRLLARLDELRAAAADTPAADAVLDEDLLLTSYVGNAEAKGGGTPGEQLANLERRFDAYVARCLLHDKPALESLLSTTDELHALLDERTVLLSQHIGSTMDGRLALATLVITREAAHGTIGVGNLPVGSIVLGGDRSSAATSWFGPYVSHLRNCLMDEPGPAEVTPEGAVVLAAEREQLFGGGLWELLGKLRTDGKDHLCIHSHGPFHYYPQHLVGLPGSPLANDWIVTDLPHPALLRRRRVAVEPGDRAPVAALGLSFDQGQPHALPPLPDAVDEARGIAAVLGGRAWVDADATESRLVEAFTGALRVHLATHGRHRVAAPAFQRVYLAPDHASDGIFHAYEVLGLDLRHLDVVTMSACETSLGRVDLGDTPRGLAACLFLAGARSVVGCLWPVESAVTSHFFTAFYEQLRAERSKLDAFAAAQRSTRATFRAYRDWGAFCFSGVW